jgi:hypothetical protein
MGSGIMKFWNNGPATYRDFIGPIYFTWLDFLSKVQPTFSLRFAQGLGTDLVKLLICCYPAQGAQIMRDN